MRYLPLFAFATANALYLLPASQATAAHECRRAIHETFEANFHRLNVEFDSRKRALHEEHHANRMCVLDEIRHAERVLCSEERASVVRQLHHRLRQLDRHYHRRLRSLHEHVEGQRDALRYHRDHALQSCHHACSGACGADIPHLKQQVTSRYAPPLRHADWTHLPAQPRPAGNYTEPPLRLLLRELLARHF